MTLVRPAVWQDLPKLAQLSGWEPDQVWHIAMRIGRADRAIQVVEQDGRLVSYSSARIVRKGQRVTDGQLPKSLPRLRHLHGSESDAIIQPMQFGYIDGICVRSDLHQSVSEALVQSSLQWLARQGSDEVQTGIGLPGGEAQTFFQRLGFEPHRILVEKTVSAAKRADDVTAAISFNLRQQGVAAIRSAERDDLGPLAELFCQEIETQQNLARHFQLIPDVDWDAFVLATLRRRDAAVRVAEHNNELVGYILACITDHGRHTVSGWLTKLAHRFARPRRRPAERYGLIEDVFVLPTMRQQGFATALLQWGLDWFQGRDVTRVQAAIWEGNSASLSLFQKLGFEPTRLMMRKRLRLGSEGG